MPVVFDARTPTWESLRLDRHVTILKCALVPYFLLVCLFWWAVLGGHRPVSGWVNAVGWSGMAVYLLLVGEAFYIQKVMHDSCVYKHGAWQVLVGAVLLNPCAFGWWMPVSVLLAARRVRSRLDAFHDTRIAGPYDASILPRAAGASWTFSASTVILVAIALLVLFLAWHFAQIKPAR